jgi:hypothetical protein
VAEGQLTETPAKARVAEALQRHIDELFDGNLKRAAEDLGYQKQRLYSYTSQTNFPSAEVFDKIKERWAVDLLNVDGVNKEPTVSRSRASEAHGQLSLFDNPVRLANEGVQITLERKGAGIAVGIMILPDVKVA